MVGVQANLERRCLPKDRIAIIVVERIVFLIVTEMFDGRVRINITRHSTPISVVSRQSRRMTIVAQHP